MGLYRRLLKERAEEDQRGGGSLQTRRDLGSRVLVRRLGTPRKRPGYAADLSMMHRLIKRSPRNAGEGMRLRVLKVKYLKENEDMKVEVRW
jgi:hypothetical protein